MAKTEHMAINRTYDYKQSRNDFYEKRLQDIFAYKSNNTMADTHTKVNEVNFIRIVGTSHKLFKYQMECSHMIEASLVCQDVRVVDCKSLAPSHCGFNPPYVRKL